MIFYDCPTAPSPRRARILLAEKKVAYSTINIDLVQGDQFRDEFRAINPACTVPALKLDDGTVFTDNAGIAAYLESEFTDQPMLGTTSVEKGMVAGWTSKIEFEGLYAVAEALRNSSPGMQNRAMTGAANWVQIPELAERGLARLKLFFDMLNEHLAEREFVAIDTFSNADITTVVAVDFSRVVRVKPLEHHTHLIRWRDSLRDRPSLRL